jgi:chemotaxis regulatin CheY-phosphate phosphatase CheZ
MSAVSVQKPSAEFEALEAAMRETSRGTWFLDEYARRVRGTDTDRVFQSIEKLSTQITDKAHAPQFDILRLELESMAAGIARTRREIASIKPQSDVPGSDRIIAATEELDLVLRSTENATAEILTAAESLQALSGKFRESGGDAAVCDEIDNHATNLMIACSFQDLTGQRMTKVVNALRYIEQRVNSMIAIWGVTDADAKGTGEQTDERPDAHLLNGPQRAGDGVAQVDVDRMLTGGDAPAAPGAPAPVSPTTTSSQNDIDALFS